MRRLTVYKQIHKEEQREAKRRLVPAAGYRIYRQERALSLVAMQSQDPETKKVKEAKRLSRQPREQR